ncbi:hypothetical protein QZH41_008086 [Actinostola sp. cb2023]|nr:hypothetical protein QZH41_008086 [Actinostola sp. cb2023]
MQAPKLRSQSEDEVQDNGNDFDEETNHVQDKETSGGSASPSVGQDLEDSTPVSEVNEGSVRGDEETVDNDSSTEPNESVTDDVEDSVASSIKKNIVNNLPQDKITSVKSESRDSVTSYIELEDQDKGIPRNKIPENEDNDDEEDDDDDGTSSENEDAPPELPGDSVASYINQFQEKGEAKDTISAKPKEQDSVSPYIGVAGSPRNEIAQNKDNTNEPVDPSAQKKGGDTDYLISKSDSVAPYINLVDRDSSKINENNEPSTHENSVNELETSSAGEFENPNDKEKHLSKTQEILEGLENLSTEDTNEKKSEDTTMKELSPDMIQPHQMVGELWLERSYQTNTTTTSSYVNQSLYIQPYVQPQYTYIDIKHAEKDGAVCLDGSTPGFFYRKGVGVGVKNWIIYLQGGAWCHSKMDCYNRSKSNLGSSIRYKNLINVEGLLSRDYNTNPNFYNWHVVYMPYCDGASYTGNRTNPVVVKGRMIYFRGKRILSALLDDLLSIGMNQAEKVVFSGTSAGGLAVLLHADYVRQRIVKENVFPSNVQVHSLADAGMFLNVANLKKENAFGKMMRNVYKLHESSKTINRKCASHQGKANAWKCFFPYYFGEYIDSPVFIINPLYDSWQLGNVIGIHCAKNLRKCTKREMKAIIDFREYTLKALEPLMDNPKIGLFADGCFDHGQIIFGPKWNEIRVRNRSMSETTSVNCSMF